MKDVLVNLEHISKSYDSHMVLDDLNLYIRENEFLTPLRMKQRLPPPPRSSFPGRRPPPDQENPGKNEREARSSPLP